MLHIYGSAEPDGTPCYYEVIQEHVDLPPDVIDVYTGIGMYVVLEYADGWWEDATEQLGSSPRQCVFGPGPDAPPTPGEITPAVADQLAVLLPEPAVGVDPGEVVTGLPAYLEAQWDDQPAPIDSDCPEVVSTPSHLVVHDDNSSCDELLDDIRLHIADLQVNIRGLTLDVTLDAVARYVVDWGDGAAPEEFTIEGFPYPDGTVRHTYQSVPPEGEVTITIQEYWTVEWTVDSLGTFPLDAEMAPPPTEVTVPVTEIQAVVQ